MNKKYSEASKKSWKEAKKEETKKEMELMIDQLLNADNISGFLDKKLFKFPDTVPCSRWSMLNQFKMFMLGSMDCRGFNQWLAVGRQVKKGSKSVRILVPVFKKIEDKKTKEEKSILAYFKGVPVFKVEDTEGEPLDYFEDLEIVKKLDPSTLPLIEIAEALDIPVKYGLSPSAFGTYSYNLFGEEKITLCTDSEQTFFHELSHAIDRLLIGDKFKDDSKSLKEVTAEFTACYLASVYGHSVNMLYTREYVKSWSGKTPPVDKLFKALSRAVNIVTFISEKKEELLSVAV